MITLNAIAKRLEEFATNHFFIRSYSFGSPDDVDLDKFQEFPLMHVVYTGSDYDERTKTFSFEVYVFDRPNREEQMTINQREVVSDAQLCLEDIIADIANGGNIFLFEEDYEVSAATVTPLVDERSNLLTGALLDFTIQVPFQRDACNLPVNGVSPEGGQLSYARRGILRVKTQDGATDILSVNEIRVTNGTLTDEGSGVVSIDTGGVDILGDLTDVNLTDLEDHEALVYDQDAATWINGASTKIGIRVINKTGFTLFKAAPVKVVGVQGDQLEVEIFRATDDPKYFVGLLSEEIANNATGYARQTGMIYGLNTNSFEVGDILYPRKESVFIIGGNGLGYMVDEPPSGLVRLAKIPAAIVVRKHANTGRVYVRTWSPGFSVADLRDVVVVDPQPNQLLRYDSANQTWTNSEFLPGLNDLRDVDVDNPESIPNKSLLRWDASVDLWRVIPETGGSVAALPNTIAYFLGRYNDEASTARQLADATLTIERYLSVQADGHGEEVSAQTDTPTSGNIIVRKIWHKDLSFEESDVTTWTLVHTFADDTAYNDTIATFNELLTAATYGSIPFTLAQTWEEVTPPSGLLQDYPGAAAAYSLRLLDGDYTGDAIRIRRSGDNAETDIGFDGAGELDRDAIHNFCSPGDGFVKVWYDQSGNANDATQATTANQPKIYDAATGLITRNGLPGIATLAGQGWTFTAIPLNDLSVFVIGNTPANAAMLYGNFNATRLFFMGVNFDILYATTTNGAYSQPSADTFNSHLRTLLREDGVSESVYYDGSQLTQLVQGGSGQINVNSTMPVRVSDPSRVFQEIIIYPSDQSANRTAIESNINDFYDIY